MCGIAGIIDLEMTNDPQRICVLRRMANSLMHRGPDQQGIFESPQVLLANNRLAIMDPTPHSQLPMESEDHSLILCYNGEVSNFHQLAKEFKLHQKYRFVGSSDTEVLLHLYQELGIDCIKHLNGMFSFALYDRRINKVFIVRDHFGILPLFYADQGTRIVFASEIKALLSSSLTSKSLAPQAFYDLLSLGYIPGEQTPFKEIKELPGSEYLEIDLLSRVIRKHEYYCLAETMRPKPMTEKQAISSTKELLFESVRRHLQSDVPLGFCLSGGIDSSSIIGVAKALGQSKGRHSFSIRVCGSSYDESAYQREMADFAGTIHHQVSITPQNVLEQMTQHMAFMDEPYGHGAAIPSFLLAQTAKQHVKTVLSGEGGDEIFCAYDTYAAFKLKKHYQKSMPTFGHDVLLAMVEKLPVSHKKLSLDFKLKRFLQGVNLSTPHAHMYWRHLLTEQNKRQVMTHSDDFLPTERYFDKEFYQHPLLGELERLELIDLKHFLVGDLMVKNDRMFLANSVESRFPLIDRLLAEHVLSIPVEMRFKGITPRWLQKQVIKDLIPQSILARPRFGLEMPYSSWLNREMLPLSQKIFNQSQQEKMPFFNWGEINRLWQEHHRQTKDHGRFLWCILLTSIWHQLFIESNDYQKHASISNHTN